MSAFRPPGSLPRPRTVGRLVRLVAAGLALWVLVSILLSVSSGGEPVVGTPGLGFLFVAAFSLLAVNGVVNVALCRNWGRWAWGVAVAAVFVLVAVDLIAYERLWAPPLAWFLVVLTELVMGLVAVSLILGALLAAPG